MPTVTDTQTLRANWRTAWLEGRTAHTAKAYAQALRIFERWFEQQNSQEFDLPLLNSWDLRAWREHALNVEKAAPATWNLRLAAIASLAAWAVEHGLLEHDPLRGVKAAEQQAQAPRWLTAAEFGRLMRRLEVRGGEADTPLRKRRAARDAALLAIMLLAGLREAEATSLETTDVKVSERSGSATVRLGKGQKMRLVPLSSEARRFLNAWLEYAPAGKLFENITPRMVQRITSQIGEEAHIEGLTPHRLRHTCGKRLLDAGRPLTEVQMILGHRKLETTGRYLTPGWEDLTEAVETIPGGRGNRRQS